jgi:hypothetical protein
MNYKPPSGGRSKSRHGQHSEYGDPRSPASGGGPGYSRPVGHVGNPRDLGAASVGAHPDAPASRHTNASNVHADSHSGSGVPDPGLEAKLRALLKSDQVARISFVVPNKADKQFPHDIYIDGDFFARTSELIGQPSQRPYISVVVVDDNVLSRDVAAETGAGYSVVSKAIRTRRDSFDAPATKAVLVHEATHAGLAFGKSKLTKENSVEESPSAIYWALGEAIAYVADGYFAVLNGGKLLSDDSVSRKAFQIAKKAQARKDHRLDPGDIGDLIKAIRNSPVYQENLADTDQYWDRQHTVPVSKRR